LKRIEVWIDCDADQEEETRRKLRDALDKLDIDYSILASTTEIRKKGSQK
jgi:hypothetical protein